MSIYSGIFQLNIVIVHSYVSLPEGTQYPIALRIVKVFFYIGMLVSTRKKHPSRPPQTRVIAKIIQYILGVVARNPIGDGL
jgi:hypothetical protein